MGQFVRANSRPGRRGYAGDSWQDPSGLNHGDFTPQDSWQDPSGLNHGDFTPSWQDPSGLNHGDFTPPWQDPSGLNHGNFTPYTGRRTVFPDAGSGNNQTINPFGFIGRGIRALGHKLQGLRGWNDDGTPKTQAQWEEEREQRRAQKRINNILGRDAPATKATNINLNRLYDTLGTPKTGRNLFTEGEINRGISPAMRQIYQTPKYELMDGQGLEGTTEFNRLFKNEDEIRQMIENSNKTTSLRGNDDAIQKFRNDPVTEKPNFLKEAWENLKYETKLAAEPGMEKFDIWEGAQFQPLGPKGTRGVRIAPIPSEESLMMGDINPAYRMDQITLPETHAETHGNDNASINNLVADLSAAQQSVLDRPDVKFSYGENPTQTIENLLSPGSGFKGHDIKEKPATKEDIENWYKGTYKATAAQGGRVGYNTGGRVGILSVF